MEPIETSTELVEQSGISFVIRVVDSLARKDEVRRALSAEARGSGAERPNPFLPYDERLFVRDVSGTHVCLLNKFNVIDAHLLIVTRSFEEQDAPLDVQDFEALWSCLSEAGGLGFYNGGEAAGASQRHKHLQLIPLPLDERLPDLPIEPLLMNAAPAEDGLLRAPGLPFVHVLVRLEGSRSTGSVADELTRHYREMVDALGLAGDNPSSAAPRLAPYNLLVTREWMLLVPRSAEFFEKISVNAIGFAGGLLVRSREQLEMVERVGPLTVLSRVAIESATRRGRRRG